jgi:Flp pilus assembly protein TadG
MSKALKITANYRRTGVAAVEFAIISPLMIVFVLAIIEITNAIYLQQSLTIAAYEGARVALLPGTGQTNVKAASNRILDARKISGATISIEPSTFDTEPFGANIKVDVQAPLAENGLFNRLFSSTQNFSASVTMMKER